MSIKKKTWFAALAVLALVAVLMMVSGTAFGHAANPASPTIQTGQTGQTDQLFNDIYERVSPSVVAINVVSRQPGTGFFGQDNQVIASGSGFVIDKQGHIVTNNHVVEGATSIEVNFLDGTIVRGEIVGLDPDSDLAVIKVDLSEDKLYPVELGDSDSLMIGQTVLAIGSPFGQRWTLTSGIVSALDRTIRGLTNFSIGGVIQTDASINPGNSGGPLLDLDGRVIGVNSQIMSDSRSSSGVGFAIPSNLVQRVAKELIDNGYINYSYLGITGGDVNLAIIEAFGLANNQRGVVVADVTAGGPAARAGLLAAGQPKDTTDVEAAPSSLDIITAIDGHPLDGIDDLITYLAKNTTPGQTVTLSVLRDGKDQLQLEAKLTPRPSAS
jgi:S1-C subfamily serine protease